MISGSTTKTSSTLTVMADVRCLECGKLIIKWRRSGTATIEYKCTRCGDIARLNLST